MIFTEQAIDEYFYKISKRQGDKGLSKGKEAKLSSSLGREYKLEPDGDKGTKFHLLNITQNVNSFVII